MEKKVEFKVGETTLRGSVFVPDGTGPFPAVIFFHGNGGKGEKYFEAASKFPQKGIMAFAFNFRGCGISDGNYLTQTHQDSFIDAQKAFEFLLSQNVDPERIGVIGGSFGGYIAAMLLPKLTIKSLVLLGPSACVHPPPSKLDMGGLRKEIEYFADKLNWESAQSYINIANFKGPLLVIRAGNDENVPKTVVERYFNKAFASQNRQIKTIIGADHRLSIGPWKEEFYNLILDWFSNTL